jgi:hypothetical protein
MKLQNNEAEIKHLTEKLEIMKDALNNSGK